MVEAIRDTKPSRSPYGQHVADARVVLNSRRSWMICYTKREANAMAQELARAVVSDQTDSIWVEEISLCIFDLVALERSSL
jgi:hypothetical protein